MAGDASAAIIALTCVLGVSVLLIIRCTASLCWKPVMTARHYRKQGVCGTAFKPIVGDVPFMLSLRRDRPVDNFYATFELLAQQAVIATTGIPPSPDAPRPATIFIHLGGSDTRLLTTSPELIQAVLTDTEAFDKAAYLRRILSFIMGNSLLLARTDTWRVHRRIINPSFHFEALKGMLPLMHDATQAAIERNFTATSLESAEERDVHMDVSALALEIIGRSAFGHAFEPGSVLPARIYGSVTHLLDAAVAAIYNFSIMLPAYPALAKLWHSRHLTAIAAALNTAITTRRAQRALTTQSSSVATGKGTAREMLLDILLEAGMSDEQVTDEAVTFILAGHETTAQALTWAMMLLAQHPEWKERAHADVTRVTAGSSITHEHLAALPILNHILQETMRLYPPAPVIVREAVRDVHVVGLHILKDTVIAIPISMLHRDAELWKEPHAFRPQRWEGGMSAAMKHPFAYMPFSAGPRNCIGSQFALMEARVMLALLVRECDWALMPSYVHAPTETITLRPAHGMPMKVWRR